MNTEEFYLTCDVALVLRRANLLFWHTENERKCTPKEGAQRKRMGVLSGVPDIIIATRLPQWACIGWELKVANRKLSVAQTQVREQLLLAGWRYDVIRSLDEAIALVHALWPGRLQ